MGATSAPAILENRASQGRLTLALISAVIVPQFGMGLSTPALPQIAEDFHRSVQSAQATMVIYMIGYAASMLASGLMSDRFGPRPVQLAGLLIAGVAALAGALAPNLFVFSVARFAQAFGGCAGTVTARLIVRQEYQEHERMRILTTLASAIALTPCIAPLLGGSLATVVGWRGLFDIVSGFTLIACPFFLMTTRGMRDVRRVALPDLAKISSVYARNLADPGFRRYALAISLVWMSYFGFASCSSYPLQVGRGLSASRYGLVLAIAAVGYVSGSAFARRLACRHDLDVIMFTAAIIGAVGAVTLVVAATIPAGSVFWLAVPAMAVLFTVGMVIPTSHAGLLRCTGQDPGITSGLFFFLQMISGAAYAAIGNSQRELDMLGLALLVALPCCLFAALCVLDALNRRRATRRFG